MTNPHHPHHRRSIRVPGYDYTNLGAYFLTLCTHKRLEIFGAIVDHEMKLSLPGKIAQQEMQRLAKRFPHIRLGEFVVMPNHVHAVIFILDHENRTPTEEVFGQPVHGSIPTIVRSYKSSVTLQVNSLRETPQSPRLAAQLLQAHHSQRQRSETHLRLYPRKSCPLGCGPVTRTLRQHCLRADRQLIAPLSPSPRLT
jgi:hypothetical protein